MMTFDTQYELQELRAIQHEYVRPDGTAYTTLGWDASFIIGKTFKVIDMLESEITMLENELEGLHNAYQYACNAADLNQERAKAAESEIRQILDDIER